MSKCLSLSRAALLCNNSSYVLLRLDLESFIKAGPSRRRGERIAACVGGLGLRSPNSEGTDDIMDSHGKFMKLQFSSPEQSSQAVCILSAGAFNAPESQDRDTSRWYFKIWHSKRLEDLQALAGHFWTETIHSKQEAGSRERRGGHHTRGFCRLAHQSLCLPELLILFLPPLGRTVIAFSQTFARYSGLAQREARHWFLHVALRNFILGWGL